MDTQDRMIRAARRMRSQDSFDVQDLQAQRQQQENREADPTAFDKRYRSDAHLINLNTASKEELEEIKGIGPSLSQAIIDHRPIQSLDELINSLHEMSPQTAERLRKITTL